MSTNTTDKMFGPLTFVETKQNSQSIDETKETKCLLCEDSFNLNLRLDIFVRHIFEVHNIVIEEVQNIANLDEYISYWREKLQKDDLERIIPSVSVDSPDNRYFLLSSLLKEDKTLRHKLKLEHVLQVQEFERVDKHYLKTCLFCKLEFEGSRQEYLEHLSLNHNLQLGNPQNLVFIEELVEKIDGKLRELQCIYCEKIFTDRNTLKEHMRKKLHKRINPQNAVYDKYYIVNYLEEDKSWLALEQEDDRIALPRGIEQNADEEYSDWDDENAKLQITCLFCDSKETDINLVCLHMDADHDFDFVKLTQDLDFYQRVKLINYIRRQIHTQKCVVCNESFTSKELLQKHLRELKHCSLPDLKLFDQPEFYFPTYENDAFLYFIDDVED